MIQYNYQHLLQSYLGYLFDERYNMEEKVHLPDLSQVSLTPIISYLPKYKIDENQQIW